MIDGSLIMLRPPLPGDRKVLHALRNDARLQSQLMVLPRANSEQRVEEWLSRMLSDPACAFFVIAGKANDEALGYIQVKHMDFVHGTGELGICVAETSRGGGRAAEALTLIEGYVGEVFNLRKLLLYVLAANARAIRFYEKSGYHLAGTLRKHFYLRRSYHDVAIYEKLLI